MKKYLLSIITAVALLLLAVPGAALADETAEVKYSVDKGPWTEATLIDAIWAGYMAQEIEIELQRNITITPAYGVVMANKNCSLVLDGNGYTITRGEANRPLFSVNEPGSSVTLKDITIDGGAVWSSNTPEERTNSGITNSGTMQMFAVSNGATLTLESGTILQNNDLGDSGYGAAVYVDNGGSLIMKPGSSIKNNAAQTGGGVCILTGGNFTMEGGTISGNYAYASGGAVYTSGNMEMKAGSIENNVSSNNGGGVCVSTNNNDNAAFTMGSGEITGNKSPMGGGVSILNGETFNMNGGKITANSATSNAGGVLVHDGSLAVSGAPQISGNTVNAAANNVYLTNGKTISIDQKGLQSNAQIGITMATKTGTFTSGWATYMAGQSPINYFSSDVNGYAVDLDAAGEAQIRVAVSSAIDQAAATNGSYTVQVDGADVTAPVTENKTVTITATPDKGYQVDTVTVAKTDDPSTVVTLSGSGNTRTFTMPDYAVTVTVTFAKAPTTTGSTTYRPDIDAGEGGSVTVSPSRPEYGDKVTIKPQPEDGYQVAKVTVTDKDGDRINITDNGDGTYTFTQPRGKVTIEVSFREALCDGGRDCPCYRFSDVDTALWYHQALDYVVANGLMNGTGSATFAPYTELSRGMLVTILWRMEEQPVVNYAMTFEDVAADAYYAEAIRWAAANEVVTGHSSSVFGPDEAITREQLAAILYRSAQYQGMEAITLEENLGSFADSGSISAYAVTAMNWAVGQGVINGNGSNMLSPTGTATRAEAAQMLMNYQQNIAPTLAD